MRFKILLMVALSCTTLTAHAGESVKQLELTSSSFENNGLLPSLYTCDASDVNPTFEIKNIPVKAKTLAFVMLSPDAPEGEWVHWVAYNIDPKQSTIKQGASIGTPLFNDFGKFNYNGPCPSDDKEHQYVFTVYALDTLLKINEGGILKDLQKAMHGHILGQASLIGLYHKESPQ